MNHQEKNYDLSHQAGGRGYCNNQMCCWGPAYSLPSEKNKGDKTEQFMTEVHHLKDFFTQHDLPINDTIVGNLAARNLAHFGYRDAPNDTPKSAPTPSPEDIKGESHCVCTDRLEREGGKATCCYCNPHENCELQRSSAKRPTL